MEVEIELAKDLNTNAGRYFDENKKSRKKIKKLKEEIEKTKNMIKNAAEREGKKKKQEKTRREKKWYEQFHWFFTTNGFLAIAGKSAKQNDLLYSKHLEDNDLFFHADIQGGAATILKKGKEAEEIDLKETARFAACYSRAWKVGYAAVDVYHVEKSQLGKYATGGYVGKGGFTIKGKRTWYKSTPLMLSIKEEDGVVKAYPGRKREWVIVVPGGSKPKGRVAKKIKEKYNYDLTQISQALPSGNSKILEGPKNA